MHTSLSANRGSKSSSSSSGSNSNNSPEKEYLKETLYSPGGSLLIYFRLINLHKLVVSVVTTRQHCSMAPRAQISDRNRQQQQPSSQQEYQYHHQELEP